MKLCMTALVVCAGLLAQQQQQPEPAKPKAQKIFQIKHADVQQLLNAFHILGNMRVDHALKVMVVEATPEAIAAIEDALKRLDVPPPPVRNVELTFHMVVAGQQPTEARPLPADLEGVGRNLGSLFGYKSFGLIDTAVLRSRSGQNAEANGLVPSFKAPLEAPVTFQLRCVPNIVATDKGTSIRIDNLRFGFRMPVKTGSGGFTFNDLGFNTQIDVREGQKVVVGKANMDTSDSALVLVVTAKVVD